MTDWLKTLGMEEYTEVFHRAGYKTGADVENLKEIDEQELKRMRIIKMGMNYYNRSLMPGHLPHSTVLYTTSP